jgi:hypothetical protein
MDERRAGLQGQHNTKFAFCAAGVVIAVLLFCEFCGGIGAGADEEADGSDSDKAE